MITGYKEWSLVCEALGSGAQTVLLRKGGIAEGREGFVFKHRRFHLFPTLFHQQEEQVRWTPRHEKVRDEDGSWLVRYEAELVATAILTDWGKVQALQPYHIWKESVVRERFDFQEGGRIHAALVRVKKREVVMKCPETKELGGCRSWVEYSGVREEFPGRSVDVLADSVFQEILGRVDVLLKF